MKSIVASTILALILGITASGVSAQDAPPSSDRAELIDSPRHQEWVRIRYDDRTVRAFVVYPEVAHEATAVLVIHENRGLTDWVRSVADRLADNGYVAMAPDLLSGMGPDGGKTSDFPDPDAAREAIYALDPAQVTADLIAAANYVRSLPAANDTVSVAGFCWGGSQAFRFATNYPEVEAAFVFYGTAPSDGLDRIEAPVYGFYGGNDARVGATIEPTREAMAERIKTYEPVTYDGAGHGFMRRGEAPDASEADAAAMHEGWERWLKLLAQR